MKTVMFCGCNCIPYNKLDEFNNNIRIEVKKAIDAGATEFLFYDCGNFTLGCALIIKDFKRKYPKIKSVMYDMSMIHPIDLNLFDFFETSAVEECPFWIRQERRCQQMVDRADMVMMFIGANDKLVIDTLIYARETGKRVIIL